MSMCICTRTCTYMYTYIYVCVYKPHPEKLREMYIHVYMDRYKHAYMFTQIHGYSCVHACLYTFLNVDGNS